MKFTLSTRVKTYQHPEHGNRLLFIQSQTNPRDQTGKNGVIFHDRAAAIFHQCLHVSAVEIDPAGREIEREFYLNKKSLLKYMQAIRPELAVQLNNDREMMDQLTELLQTNTQTQQGKNLRHAGQHTHIPLANDTSDYIRGKFYSWFYQQTISSYSAIKARFVVIHNEADYLHVGESLAKLRFNEAAQTIPAYAAHLLASAAFQAVVDKQFHHIPLTTKDNYIKANESQGWRLHQHGLYPAKHKVDTSTGTTGKPTVWIKGEPELETVKKSLRVAIEVESGDRPLIFINAFALGPWATGMTIYELMRSAGSTFATGPDIGKIIDYCQSCYNYNQHRLEEEVKQLLRAHPALGFVEATVINTINSLLNLMLDNQSIESVAGSITHYSARQRELILAIVQRLNKTWPQIVIAGYPPFLKDLVDHANANGTAFAKFHARGVVGGQAISEALRDKLMQAGFSKINSSYGASDLDINIGVETAFEIQLRRELEKNPALANELYGKNKCLPMVFHYDPLNYFIEVDEDDNLIYTCNRNDRSSPRIRYKLGDLGRVFAVSDIEALLIKHGIHHLKPRVNFPLLFVWGRDSAVAYRGSKVSFNDLERAITNLDPANQCVKRAFYCYEEQGEEKFEIWIELKDGCRLPDLTFAEPFLKQLLQQMGKLNQDLAYHLELKNEAELPRLRLFANGKSPISNADGVRKQVLVFKQHHLPDTYHLPALGPDMQLIAIDKAFYHQQALSAPYSPRFMAAPPPVQGAIEPIQQPCNYSGSIPVRPSP